jgi:hypothetical protein
MISRLLEFLFSLQHVRITPNTRFTFVWNYPVLIVLGAIALAAIGYTFYFRQSASPNKRRAMGVVRALLLVVVFLLVWRPQLVMEHEERTRSVVAVWVDSSASMTLEDPYTGAPAEMRDFLRRVGAPVTPPPAPSATGPAANPPARATRYQVAAAALGDTGWLKELATSQDVLFFTGAGHAQPVGTARRPEEIDPLLARVRQEKPVGDTTDVPAVVREILEKVQGQRLSAMVLVTDGQTTEKGSRLDAAAALAQQADAKVFAVPVGQETEPFDLKLSTMRLPPGTFTKDPVSARIHLSAAGVTAPTPVRINVYRKPPTGGALGAPLASKDLTLDPTKKELDTDISLKLDKKDPGKGERFDLVARIEPASAARGEEPTLKNNEVTGTVTVLDAQINVLYVEGYPRWEFRYLKTELIREPTVNLATLLVSADEDFHQDADPPAKDRQTGEETFPGSIARFPDSPQDLARFDVLILGDIEPTYFSPTQQKLIVDWVKTRGGGLAWVAGANWNPETYRETPLEVLLPVIPDEIDPRARVMLASDNTPFTPVVTPAGRETNLFRFFDDPELSIKQVADLPQMYWYKPVPGLKPGSIVLAVHPTRSQGGNPAPLLVQRQFGAGPVLFSAYADTWRWRRYTGEPLFQSYWLQFCRLLYANKAMGQSKRLELVADATRVEIGQPIKLALNIKDPTLAGQVPPEVRVSLMDSTGQSVDGITLSRAPGATNAQGSVDKLEGAVTAARVGEYTLVVQPGTLPVDLPPVDLVVEPPQREFENVTTDLASLRSIATKTTGAVVAPYATADLTRQIPDRSTPILMGQSEELWNKPFALLLVVLLATIEWLIRKSAGLI